VDEELAVNFGSVHLGPAFPKKLGLIRGPQRKNVILAANQLALVLPADLPLDLHQLAAPSFDFTTRNFVLEMIGRGTLLIRVAKDAQPVELRGLHELAQLGKVWFLLAGESNDERRPQG